LLIILFLLLFLPAEGSAAMYSNPVVPKYRISGLLELTYQDYSVSITQNGQTSKGDTKTFDELIKLGVEGYLIHPKLALYSVGVGFRHETAHTDEIKGTERDITYGFSLTLLPQRPYSLDLYASRETDRFSSEGRSSDLTTNTYGATLRLSLKDMPFLKPKAEGDAKKNVDWLSSLPYVTLSYDHYEYDATNFKRKLERDLFGINMIGYIRAINTKYTLLYEYWDYSGVQGGSLTSQNLSGFTDTVLSKGKSDLSTSFRYSSTDFLKFANFSADLTLTPTERFSHMYTYNYYHTEEGLGKTDTHYLEGQWDYRFTERFLTHGRAWYQRITRTDEEADQQYGTAGTLSYSKLFKGINFYSNYHLSYLNSTLWGDIMENNVLLGLRTMKLKWGTVYADYHLLYQTTSNKGDLTQQVVRTGVLGRGPGRAFWSVGGSVRSSRAAPTTCLSGESRRQVTIP
jgi:hypothetical protein